MDFESYDLNGLALFYKMITEMGGATVEEMQNQKDLQSSNPKIVVENILGY